MKKVLRLSPYLRTRLTMLFTSSSTESRLSSRPRYRRSMSALSWSLRAGNVADLLRLVGDVRLVEVRRLGCRDVTKVPQIARCGLRIARRPDRGAVLAVRVVRVVVEEERLGAWRPGLDQPVHLGAEDVVDVVGGLARVVVDFAVLVELEAVALLLGSPGEPEPLLPARGDLPGVDQAVAVQVLADHRRAVLRALQPDRERVRAVEVGETLVGADAVVVRVLAGELRGARRATEGVAHVAVAKGGAACAEQGEGVPHHEHVRDVHVVRVDQDHVGPLLARVLPPQLRTLLSPSVARRLALRIAARGSAGVRGGARHGGAGRSFEAGRECPGEDGGRCDGKGKRQSV